MPSYKDFLLANLDERQRLRLVLLLMAGLLLLGGTWLWVNTKMHQEDVAFLATSKPAPLAHTNISQKLEPIKTKEALSSPGGTLPSQQANKPSSTLAGEAPLVKTEPAGNKVESALPLNLDAKVSQELKQFPPTPRILAQSEARQGAGKANPCERVEGYQVFPRTKAVAPGTSAAIEIPPPPLAPKESFVPPPPPTQGAVVESTLPQLGQPEEGLSVSELPEAPSKPSISEKLKLIGVIGDKAVLAFTDRMWRKENKYPKTITLGRGEQFESLSLVEINPDSITLEEDGERLVKRIEPLK